MKIYTRTGDSGQTGLYGGPRVRKDALRIEAYGTVDELNAVLGMARSFALPAGVDLLVQRLQNELFDVGAELASPEPATQGTQSVDAAKIAFLETAIDAHDQTLPPLKQFILPGGSSAAASLHFARTVCRRAERLVVTLSSIQDERISPSITVYLNRLSDLLFVLARAVNQSGGHADMSWQKPDERA